MEASLERLRHKHNYYTWLSRDVKRSIFAAPCANLLQSGAHVSSSAERTVRGRKRFPTRP